MHYVIGDIHNEAKKLAGILSQIQLKSEDELFILGDVFDRGGEDPDPVGTYFQLLGVQGRWTWIRGNHDQWLADYIKKYFAASARKRLRRSFCKSSGRRRCFREPWRGCSVGFCGKEDK